MTEITIPLTSDEIAQGVKALKLIGNSAKKQRGYYLAFGEIWLKVRTECAGDKKKMGHIRKVTFNDAIDAQTASYSARMFELWEEGLKDYAETHRPKLNNPRPLVQDYLRHKKELEAVEEKLRLKSLREAEADEFMAKLAKLSPTDREKAKAAKAKELKEAALLESKRADAEEKAKAIEKLKALAKKAKVELPKTLVEEKPKTSTPTESVERFGGCLNEVIEVINKGRITPNQVETIEKHIQSLKSTLTEYHASSKKGMKKVA